MSQITNIRRQTRIPSAPQILDPFGDLPLEDSPYMPPSRPPFPGGSGQPVLSAPRPYQDPFVSEALNRAYRRAVPPMFRQVPGAEKTGLPPVPRPSVPMSSEQERFDQTLVSAGKGATPAQLEPEYVAERRAAAEAPVREIESGFQTLVSPVGRPEDVRGRIPNWDIYNEAWQRASTPEEQKALQQKYVDPYVGRFDTAGRKIARGGSAIIRGGLGALTRPEALGPVAAIAPLETAAGFHFGIPAQRGTEEGLKKLGAAPEYAQFAGDIAGLITAGKAAGFAGTRPQVPRPAPPTIAEAPIGSAAGSPESLPSSGERGAVSAEFLLSDNPLRHRAAFVSPRGRVVGGNKEHWELAEKARLGSVGDAMSRGYLRIRTDAKGNVGVQYFDDAPGAREAVRGLLENLPADRSVILDAFNSSGGSNSALYFSPREAFRHLRQPLQPPPAPDTLKPGQRILSEARNARGTR